LHATDKAIPLEQRTDVTVDELERMSLPCNAELYNGKVVFKMANPAHGMIQTNIAAELKFYLRQNPIGYIMTETNFQLWPDRSDRSRIPDVAFVKKERMPNDFYHFPAVTPDLAVEIISPDEKSEEMMDNADEYLEQGARMVWLVFPQKREVWVCTGPNAYHRVRDVLTAPDLLPGFELPVSKIFEDLPPRENS
jgi:Uma2 family endonuclease